MPAPGRGVPPLPGAGGDLLAGLSSPSLQEVISIVTKPQVISIVGRHAFLRRYSGHIQPVKKHMSRIQRQEPGQSS
jgi:hypothetical protein